MTPLIEGRLDLQIKNFSTDISKQSVDENLPAFFWKRYENVACTKNNAEMYGLICAEIESSQPFFWVGKISDDKDGPIERAVVL